MTVHLSTYAGNSKVQGHEITLLVLETILLVISMIYLGPELLWTQDRV